MPNQGSDDRLLRRVQEALGRPAATVIAEKGSDRHFILEFTFMSAALYVLGKFLDGVMKGIGVEELGVKYGETIRRAVNLAGNRFLGLDNPEEELAKQQAALSRVAAELPKPAEPALSTARAEIIELLSAAGVPRAEGERIALRIQNAVWIDASRS